MVDRSSAPKRNTKPRPLGAELAAVLKPTLAARGLSEIGLVTHWPEIVGLDVARFARFERLNWPPRGAKTDPDGPRAPATLVLRVDGAFALEAQHLSKLIVERVNAHFGWRCIEKIALRQGPLPETASPRRVGPPGPEALAAARAIVGVEDEALRETLTQLGARVIERARGAG